MKRCVITKFIAGLIVILQIVILVSCSEQGSPTAENILKSNSKAESKTSPLLIGHRGFTGSYPENTRESFIGAFENGFDGIECDIWESDNGDLMIHHDATTTRMTGIEDYIWHVNSKNRTGYAIISGSNIDNFSNRTIFIPTFQEMLEIRNDYKGYLYLHIKANDDYGYSLSDEGVNTIIKLLKDSGLAKKTFVFGSRTVVKRFLNKGLNIGTITGQTERKDINATIDWCQKNNVNTLVIWKMEAIKNNGNQKSLVKYCHNLKMKIGVYETVSQDDYKYLENIGADFAMSDYKLG